MCCVATHKTLHVTIFHMRFMVEDGYTSQYSLYYIVPLALGLSQCITNI